MNWLAHLYLSEDDAAARIGNLLPDFGPPAMFVSLPTGFQRGIKQHRGIDAFTDAHPIFRQSRQRVDPPFRRFGGILTDLIYDHFLARDWAIYSSQSLSEFTQGVYKSFEHFRNEFPPQIVGYFEQMREADWLFSYRELSGTFVAMNRLGLRLRRPLDFSPCEAILERNYEMLYSDFKAFFPELQNHAAQLRAASNAA